MTPKRKLIEVALPLESINKASAREKGIRKGHPSTFHLWWARRPLAACRAVLFASLVDDPSSDPDRYPTEAEQDAARLELFELIEELVLWENTNDVGVLNRARAEIQSSTGGDPPIVVDPFCGGGSIPLEAQRLGLETHASDLNPVAATITKALVELPPLFEATPPVSGDAGLGVSQGWQGAAGLAVDVRHYAEELDRRARVELQHMYPTISGEAHDGPVSGATPISWMWARTCTCTNPACGATVPLLNSRVIGNKPGKRVTLVPTVDESIRRVAFSLTTEPSAEAEGTISRTGAKCLVCGSPVSLPDIRSEGRETGLGSQLLATVVEGPSGVRYVEPEANHAESAKVAAPEDLLETQLPARALGFRVQAYGLTQHRDLFTARQLVMLREFSRLLMDQHEEIARDAAEAEMSGEAAPLIAGGRGARAYADAVVTYLGLSVGRLANRSSGQCFWHTGRETLEQVFARNALPMIWVYAEGNPFSSKTGNYLGQVDYLCRALEAVPGRGVASVLQRDARTVKRERAIVCTDPPYYDNVPYADLSDFFYVWLRQTVGKVLPDLYGTVLVPKADELIAEPARHAGRDAANEFFESGLREAFSRMREMHDERFPLTVFYAFRQNEMVVASDIDNGGSASLTVSTGWETMLQGLLDAGFSILGTWPVRTEQAGGLRQVGRNALASSIVLVCRPRKVDAASTTRRDFMDALRRELPDALRDLQHGNVAPVDLEQAAIGPGIAIFSRYREVREPDGRAMTVRAALGLINRALGEVLDQQEGDLDADSRWAVAWYEQEGFSEGKFGDADQIARAKGVGVNGLVQAGIIVSGANKVSLIARDDLKPDWDPQTDKRATAWEAVQYLVRALKEGGEPAAAQLHARLGALADPVRELSYRLYQIAERTGRVEEAISYNGLVASWPEIVRLARTATDSSVPSGEPEGLF